MENNALFIGSGRKNCCICMLESTCYSGLHEWPAP